MAHTTSAGQDSEGYEMDTWSAVHGAVREAAVVGVGNIAYKYKRSSVLRLALSLPIWMESRELQVCLVRLGCMPSNLRQMSTPGDETAALTCTTRVSIVVRCDSRMSILEGVRRLSEESRKGVSTTQCDLT